MEDAAYCASPASGMDGSLAIIGAAVLADALQKHDGNVDVAFEEYNESFRPFIESMQAQAEQNLQTFFLPRTEEDVQKSNAQKILF